MKKIIYILAMAAVAAVSCQKFEKEAPVVNETPAFTRTLYACFDGEVKTALGDDYTPAWVEGDVINLYAAGQTPEAFEINDGDIVEGKVRIETSLTGDVYAIYGAATATLSGSTLTFDITNKIGTEFKDAHVCVAKDVDGVLSFKNATSIICLKNVKTSGAQGVSLTAAANEYCWGKMGVTFDDAGEITSVTKPTTGTGAIVDGTNHSMSDALADNEYTKNGQTLTVTVTPMSTFTGDNYYISVVPENSYSFSAKKDYQAVKDKGTVSISSLNECARSSKKFSRNKIYTLTVAFNN